jgi:nucleoside-diphosphate-sugar epimerase
MPRLLIAGCGYVGLATAELFRGAGWEVVGWTNSAPASEKSVVVRAVNIADRGAVEAAAENFDAVIDCASSGGSGAESYREVYLEGARNLLAVLHAPRFIFTSSTSVYAQRDGEWVDEESVAEPAHETGKILREAEELVRQNGGTIARLAGIYGPGRSALLRKFLAGDAQLEPGRILNHAHRDDIAAALLRLATASAGGIFNVADDEPIAQSDACAWLAAKLNRPLPPIATEPATRKRGASNKRVSNRKLRSLGWAPRFPNFAAGMERTVLPLA